MELRELNLEQLDVSNPDNLAITDEDRERLQQYFIEKVDRDEFDPISFQLESAQRGEHAMTPEEDDRYNRSWVKVADLVKEPLDRVQEQVEELIRSGAGERELDGKTHLAETNPYAAYSEHQSLWTWRCCPRRQGYGCRHYLRRLPCFWYGNAYCCPIYPSWAVYTAYCNCHHCAVLTDYCASVGRCVRRFSNRRLLAVCRRPPWGWWYLQWFWKQVATSCHCDVYCPHRIYKPVDQIGTVRRG